MNIPDFTATVVLDNDGAKKQWNNIHVIETEMDIVQLKQYYDDNMDEEILTVGILSVTNFTYCDVVWKKNN